MDIVGLCDGVVAVGVRRRGPSGRFSLSPLVLGHWSTGASTHDPRRLIDIGDRREGHFSEGRSVNCQCKRTIMAGFLGASWTAWVNTDLLANVLKNALEGLHVLHMCKGKGLGQPQLRQDWGSSRGCDWSGKCWPSAAIVLA
jgi:hypothetical protein